MRDQTEVSGPGWLRRLPILLILAVALGGALLLRDAVSFELLRDHRDQLIALRDGNYLLAVALFMLVYVVIVAFSLPGATVATLAGGFLFSVFPGVLFNLASATVGAICIFQAARWGLGEWLARRMDAQTGAIKRFKDGIDRNQWSVLFLMRLVPAVPFFVANLLPALLGVSLTRFAVTTFFGIIPGALVLTSVGAGLGELFERDEAPDLGLIFEPQFLLPILGLCLLAALPMLISMGKKPSGSDRHDQT